MDKLTAELIAPFLEEADSKIKKVIAVFPGRFQPAGPHHLATYNWLKKKFGDAYITSSNIQGYPRHPLSFKEKQQHISKMGVKKDHIVMEKSPYVAEILLKKFDPKTTAVVYIFGAKDAGRLTGGKKKKDGGATYYQDYNKNKNNLQGYEEHGYILTAPHVAIKVGGKEVSGTVMRELLGSDKFSDSERIKLFKQAFGYSDPKTYQMMHGRFKKMFESVDNDELSLLVESPDNLWSPVWNNGPWDDDAYVFGINGGKLYAENSVAHFDLVLDDGNTYTRTKFAYPGRLWSVAKAISFWNYPTPTQLKKLMKQLNAESKDRGWGWKIDNKWQIEVVMDKKGSWARKVKLKSGWDDAGGFRWTPVALLDGFTNVLIPIDKYVGSEERSASEKGKTHLLSPLLKKINTAKLKAMNNARVKKGNVSAKQKAMATKYKFSENITESPDEIAAKGFYVGFRDGDAIPFGFKNGKAVVGDKTGQTHGDMTDNDGHRVGGRSNLEYAGRMWTKTKIISFWTYPKMAELPKIVNDLNKELKNQLHRVKIDMNTWNIDVVADAKGVWALKVKGIEDFKHTKWNIWDSVNVIVPLKQFNGSQKRTEKEMGKSHLLSPLVKIINKEKLKAVGSARAKKGHTTAKQKAMATKYKFSEWILNESPDSIYFNSGENIHYREKDAHPILFTTDFKKAYVGTSAQGHNELVSDYREDGISRTSKTAARIWKKKKIISFWESPDKNTLKKMLKVLNPELKKIAKVTVTGDWLIDLFNPKLTPEQEAHAIETDSSYILLPIKYYTGKPPKVDTAAQQQHLVSPIKKKIDKKTLVALNKIRSKKGHISAKEKALITKYKFTEEFLNESPDFVYTSENGDSVKSRSPEAYSFAPDENSNLMYISDKGRDHSSMWDKFPNNDFDWNFSGRVWIKSKIISFWFTPPKPKMKQEITRINKALKKATGVQVTDDWKMELGDNYLKKHPDLKDYATLTRNKTILLPVGLYKGNPPKHDAGAYQQHKLSPLKKKVDQKKLSAMGKTRAKKGHTTAKQKAMATKYKFSEEKLNENPDVLEAGKFHAGAYDYDAYSFGWYQNELWANYKETHWDLEPNDNRVSRENFAFPGRLWAKRKLMSFWIYPSQAQLKKLVKELNKKSKELNWKWKIDNSWQVEVVLDPDGKWARKIKVYDDLTDEPAEWKDYSLSSGYENVILPIDSYAGSVERSKSERGKSHLLSPMLKDFKKHTEKLRAMNSARAKKGHVTAKQKAMATKYKFTEQLLKENPDHVDIVGGGEIWYDQGGYAFGMKNNKAYVSIEDDTHGDIHVNGETHYREWFDFPGRIWPHQKIMSFWSYPTEAEFKKMLRPLKKEFKRVGVNLNPSTWSLEIVADEDGEWLSGLIGNDSYSDMDWEGYYVDNVIIPMSQYGGSEDRSKSERGKSHMLSPLLKKMDKEKLKRIKHGPSAKQRAMMTKYKFSEIADLINNEIIEKFIEETDIAMIIKEGTNTALAPTDDGPPIFYKTFAEYKRVSKKWLNSIFEETGWKVLDYILSHGAEDPENDFTMEYSTVAAVAYGKTGDGEGYADPVGRYKKHIKKINQELGWEIIKWMGIDGKKTTGVGVEAPVLPGANDGVENSDRMEKDKKVNESVFTKDWWIDEFENEELLQEGGAYGHMAHPFDNKDLTFGDLKKIIELGLGGQLNREDHVSEKLDGQNLMLSWKNGKLIAARNKGHIKNAGKTALDMKGMAAKFKGRGEIYKAFVYAMKDLGSAIGKLSDKQKTLIFDEGKNFMNLEVMWPGSANVVDYDLAQIVFHGALKYDSEGTPIGEVKGSARILAGMIKQVNQNVQKHYKIEQPVFLDVPKHQDFGKLKKKFSARLVKLQNEFGLSDKDTLAMYHQAWWESFIAKKAKEFKYKIPSKVLTGLVKRWAFFDKSYTVPMIRSDITNDAFKAWALPYDKNDHATQIKENMFPYEALFFEVGATILKNVSGYLAANPDKSVQSMRDEFIKAVKEIEKGGDPKKLKRLHTQLKRLDSIGGLDSIVPTEGIVFKYNGEVYKFTGSFAPVNQIMGLLTF